MKKVLYAFLFLSVSLFAEAIEEETNKVDCLILQDENSIICKYEHERLEEEKIINVQWIDPQGEISRERELIIPAGHGSVYDFRYIEGRMKGSWQFKVLDNEKEFKGTFEIE